MGLLLRNLEDHRKCRDLGDVSETSQKLQRLLRFGGQSGEFPDHEVHDIVGVTLGVNAIEIPAPAPIVLIEGEQALSDQCRGELNGEKRIAGSLLVQQLGKRRNALHLAAKSVRDKLVEMRSGERRKRDLRYLSAGGLDGVELPHQRMSGSDFVVAIGADQQQVPQIRSGQQILKQVERRRVQPLQVVEKQRKRMLGV